MFKKDTYIIYGCMGVCKVLDITTVDNPYVKYKDYYIIQPVYSDKNAIIKVPVDNVQEFMRDILTKDEVIYLISHMNSKESCWIDDDKLRNQEFKLMLKNNVSEDLALLIRSIYVSKEEKESIGKKLSKFDSEVMVSAKKLLEEEFATSLNIPVEEVENFIFTHIENN